jgi:hypothetical protein
MTVRRLKAYTSSRHIAIEDWDNALKALCKAGELCVADEMTPKGRTRRSVTLLAAIGTGAGSNVKEGFKESTPVVFSSHKRK